MSTDSFDLKHERRMAAIKEAHDYGDHDDEPEKDCEACDRRAEEKEKEDFETRKEFAEDRAFEEHRLGPDEPKKGRG